VTSPPDPGLGPEIDDETAGDGEDREDDAPEAAAILAAPGHPTRAADVLPLVDKEIA
jgi:hypothetical protein